MNLSELPNTAIILVFVGVIFVAGFLVLSGLTEDVACESGYTYNTSSGACYETANHSNIGGYTYAGNSSMNIQEGMDNVTNYAGTWGTIIGVAVLLAIVIGGFAFGRGKGYF